MPQDHYYRLNLTAPVKMSLPPLPGILAVKRFAADGMLQGRSIAYSQPGNPSEVKNYHYHHWVDIPPLMLQEELLDYLRAANTAPDVIAGDSDINPDYLIKGRIKRLERIAGPVSEGLIELDLILMRATSRQMILHRVYHQKVKADNQTVIATVVAMNHALEKIYATFLDDLASLDMSH